MIWPALLWAFVSFRLLLVNEFLLASILFIIGASIILFYYYKNQSIKKLYIISVILGLIISGMYSLYTSNKYFSKKNNSTHTSQSIKIKGRITKISSNSILIEISKKNCMSIHNFCYSFKNILRLRIIGIKNKHKKEININDIIQTTCKLSTTIKQNTFSFFEKLQARNYSCRLTKKNNNLTKIKTSKNIIIDTRKKIRQYLFSQLQKISNKSLATSFFLADTSSIKISDLQLFRKMGIAHLFSASGLHLGLLYAIIFLPFMFFKLEKTGMLLGWLFSLLFLILLDFRIPLLRAFLFLSMYLFFKIIDKKTNSIYILFFTACVIEFTFPFSTFSISFILSAGITGVIIISYKPILSILSIKNNYIKNHLALTLSAFIKTSNYCFRFYLLFFCKNSLLYLGCIFSSIE